MKSSKTVAVRVIDVVAFASLDEVRVGVEERRPPGTSAWQIFLCLSLLALGHGGILDEAVYLLLEFRLC